MRHYAAFQLRLRPAIHPRIDLDSISANPGRTGRVGTRSGIRRWQPFHPVAGAALPLAGLGRPGGRSTYRTAKQLFRRGVRFRLPGTAALSARAAPIAGGHAAPKDNSRNYGRSNRKANRYGKELPGHPGRGSRHQPGSHRQPARFPAIASLRRVAIADGGEKQRRRPVFHAPRSYPGNGASSGAPIRRNGVRPGLRHRRLPGPNQRLHPGKAGGRSHRGSTGVVKRPNLLRAGKREPDPSHRAG